MPTAVQNTLAAGFRALRSVAGRPCLFKTLPVMAIIDETGGQFEGRRGVPDFNPRLGAIFTIDIAEVTTVPRAGETITDDTGRIHRIAAVERRGEWWRLTCEPRTSTPPPTP